MRFAVVKKRVTRRRDAISVCAVAITLSLVGFGATASASEQRQSVTPATAWCSQTNVANLERASGGTVTVFVGDGSDGITGTCYVAHTFKSSGTFVVTTSNGFTVSYTLVGGGGGGGGGSDRIIKVAPPPPLSDEPTTGGAGAGGGGGAVVTGVASLSATATYPIGVGAGGSGSAAGTYIGATPTVPLQGGSGSPSTFDTKSAPGGGGGFGGTGTGSTGVESGHSGCTWAAGQYGGSSGNTHPGGEADQSGISAGACAYPGTDQWAAPGGGGAGTSGASVVASATVCMTDGAHGGAGESIDLLGTPTYFGGGGGGGDMHPTSYPKCARAGGNGGTGGGGNGYATGSGTPGVPNSGGGGGGGRGDGSSGVNGSNAGAGGAGGSGIVVITYKALLPPTLYVVPASKSITYKSASPLASFYTFTYHSGSANGPQVSPTLTAPPTCGSLYTPTSLVTSSPLRISCGGGANSGAAGIAVNYTLDYSPTATLVITPRSVSLSSVTPTSGSYLVGTTLHFSSRLSTDLCGETVTYSLTPNPLTGSTTPYVVASGATSTATWKGGTYTVTTSFVGNTSCSATPVTNRITLSAPVLPPSTPPSTPPHTPPMPPSQTPTPAPTPTPHAPSVTLSLNASSTSVALGVPITFRATTSTTTSGAVTFYANGQPLSCANSSQIFSGSLATCITTFTATGHYDVSAIFSNATQRAQASTSVSVVAPSLTLALHFTVGQFAPGAKASVSGEGLKPGSTALVTMHSTPVVIGEGMVSPSGSLSLTVQLPNSVAAGVHHISVTGVGAGGVGALHSQWFFTVNQNDIVTAIAPNEGTEPANWVSQRSTSSPFPAYSIREHAKDVVRGTQVSFYTLLFTLGGAGAAGFASQRLFNGERDGDVAEERRRGGREDRRHKKSASAASAKVKHNKSKHEGRAWGDASFTWRFPGVVRSDGWSLSWPVKVAPISPLLGRLINDGAYLRAMVGSLAWVMPFVGVGLGVESLINVHGDAVAPSFALFVAILVVGAFDALAGFLAGTIFFVGIGAWGGIDSGSALRTLLGMAVMFFAVPLIASATRPLRRNPAEGSGQRFDRAADFVLASLFAAWGIDKIVGSLPALSGVVFPLVHHAFALSMVALGVIVGRYGLETLSSYLYPGRLALVAPAKVPFSSPKQRLFSLALKTAIFVFVAYAYLGSVWELWVGTALFVVPAVVGIYENSLPNLPRLARIVPSGVVKTVLMLVVGKLAAGALIAIVGDPSKLVSLGIVYLALPGVALSLFSNFAREGKPWEQNWFTRLAGIAITVFGVLLVLGQISLP